MKGVCDSGGGAWVYAEEEGGAGLYIFVGPVADGVDRGDAVVDDCSGKKVKGVARSSGAELREQVVGPPCGDVGGD